MKAFWIRLSKRQQLNLAVGGALALVLLAGQFLLLPFLDDVKTVNKAMGSNEKAWGEMMLLAREYQEVKRQADDMQRVLARRPRDFNMFSHLEKIAGDAGMKSNIKYINAMQGALAGPYEELPVEMKLEKITLKQLADFLYLLEAPQELIRIKRISIAKMKDRPDYLETQLQVATFQLQRAAGI